MYSVNLGANCLFTPVCYTSYQPAITCLPTSVSPVWWWGISLESQGTSSFLLLPHTHTHTRTHRLFRMLEILASTRNFRRKGFWRLNFCRNCRFMKPIVVMRCGCLVFSSFPKQTIPHNVQTRQCQGLFWRKQAYCAGWKRQPLHGIGPTGGRSAVI